MSNVKWYGRSNRNEFSLSEKIISKIAADGGSSSLRDIYMSMSHTIKRQEMHNELECLEAQRVISRKVVRSGIGRPKTVFSLTGLSVKPHTLS